MTYDASSLALSIQTLPECGPETLFRLSLGRTFGGTHDAIDVLRLIGEVDISCSGALGESIERVVQGSPRPLALSLECCRYLDCSAVNVLVGLCRTYPSRLTLVVPPDCEASLIFDVLGLREPLHVVSSLREAWPGAVHAA